MRRRSKLLMSMALDSVAIKHWVEKPNDLITTILVGNNLVNIFIAALSTAITQRYFNDDALAVSVGISTVVILIFGEIMPKTFGRNFSEKLSPLFAMILVAFYYFLYPVVKIFMFIISFLLGKNAQMRSRAVTRDDIEVMVEMAKKKEQLIQNKLIF